MTSIKEGLFIDGTPIVRMENPYLQVDVAPGVGGRVISMVETKSGHELLWRNRSLKLEKLESGSEYDPNFYGGIDELIPNDIPEAINGVECPDHGELWTTDLECRIEGDTLALSAVLPLCRLEYERRMRLRHDGPQIDVDYRIRNLAGARREFLWKLHAAVSIGPGDRVECPARLATVVPMEENRWSSPGPFEWPMVDSERADVIPAPDDTMGFLFLHDLEEGYMRWASVSRGITFTYLFDREVFPYAWYFATYGGFLGHYTAVLEPCTTMPLSVLEAAKLGQCSVLEAGEALETHVVMEVARMEKG